MPTDEIVRKRPEHKMKEVLVETAGITSVNKRFTSLKAVSTDEETERPAMAPTDEELDKINQFTKTPKRADDVIVLRNIAAANDIRDRDLDKFKTSCIKSFAKMPEPFSPIGKSFMVGHDTSKLPMGRIFDVGTQRQGDDLFLTPSVYMPNTDQYKSYIENVDFGIYWAVSVGVMIGTTECTVGAPHEFGGRYWCSQGHEKGLAYNPDSTDEDSWGWPLPVSEKSKGAVVCGCDFDKPTDFYELSQVYLGAQYFAELGKDPELGPVIKSASTSYPIIGLKAKEARQLHMEHIPDRVAEARKDFTILDSVGGDYRWQDDQDFIYAFSPATGEILCMGKAQKSTSQIEAAAEKVKDLNDRLAEVDKKFTAAKTKLPSFVHADADETEDPVALAQSLDATLDSLRESMSDVTGMDDDENFQQSLDLLTSAETSVDSLVEALGGVDADEDVETDDSDGDEPSKGAEGSVSKKAVQSAARTAKLPSEILDKVAESDDDNALSVVMSETSKTIAVLEKSAKDNEPMIAAGKSFIEALRGEVKAAYVRSKQLGETTGVNTERVEKIIDLAGNDVEMLKGMLDEYEADAKIKVGTKAVIRSSFPVDANNPNAPQKDAPATSTNTVDAHGRESLVSRLHR